MSLTASDRKTLSKKYVDIPDENSAFATNIVNLDVLIASEQTKDTSYKNLFDQDNDIIDLYHPEIDLLAGQVRTGVTEQNIQDSANKVVGNFFNPNNINVATPSLSDGIWKELKAYARNIAVGKNYQEVYATQDSEVDKMDAVSALTASIFADYTQSERQGNTPPAQLITDLTSLEAAVDDWELWLDDQRTALIANTDPDQTTEIAAAIADIDLSLAEIATWEALADLAVGGKVDDPGLDILNDEIARRTPQVAARIVEIDSRLGDITQNSDGSIAAFSGLYGARYINIDSRLNLAEGSLTKQTGLELAKRVQTENISNNNDYLQYLTDNILVASKLATDADGTNTITVEDAAEFNISDTVFVVSETQAEITGSITNKVGNIITLDFTVSVNFTLSDTARLLKEI